MGRDGVGVRDGVIRSKAVRWAVLFFLLLRILEAHAGQINFPDFHTLSSTTLQSCDEGGSHHDGVTSL